jgi:serine protease DegS
MTIKKTARFLFQFGSIGLAVAIVLLFLKPELLQRPRPVVQVRTTPPSTRPAASQHRHRDGMVYSYAAAVDKAGPSVVNIFTLKPVKSLSDKPHAFKPNPSKNGGSVKHERSLGSGVIFSNQGYILTNNHVISGASHILVMLSDGRSSRARIIGSDPDTDLAVLQIDLPRLPGIIIGDSDKLRVGDVVLAIGNPFGFGQTVTQGIVSAKRRSGFGVNTYENFIQTDAAINPGNSGGALINARGELVGINSVIFSRNGQSQGISFAIPVKTAHRIMTQIIEQGYVTRGWIGIGLKPLTMETAKEAGLNHTLGIVVTRVFPKSPADKAGIKPGDILIRINDDTINNIEQFMSLLASIKPGTRIIIQGRRDKRAYTTTATVIQRPYRNTP